MGGGFQRLLKILRVGESSEMCWFNGSKGVHDFGSQEGASFE